MTRHSRSRRILLASALLLVFTLVGTAVVFREGIREQWLLWRLDHSEGDAEKDCMAQLGTLGSLRAIEPLARRLEGLPPSHEWHFYTTPNVIRSLDALSALLSIAQTRRETSIPHILRSSIHGTGATSKEVFNQLLLVARGKQASIDLGRAPPGAAGRHPGDVEEK